MPARVYDLRRERVPNRPKVKMLRGKPELFRDGAVGGVVLHQTACTFAPPKRDKSEAGLASRALDVACHVFAGDGFWVKAAPLTWIINHGNGFNRRAFGIEIEGLFSGLLDDPTTAPRREDLDTTWQHREPTVWTPSRRDAAREALAWLVQAGRDMGHPVRKLWAHRQSSADRRSDPGQAIWQDVALWAVDALGLELEPALALPASNPKNGPGRPIPLDWDPRGVGRY